jgi:peptidoglycan hydrolase-like protein with peptidoglycan-binding domain
MLPGQITKAQATEPNLNAGTAEAGSLKYVSTRVKNIQRKLLSSGYPPGDIDGIFGPHTSRAIFRYQKKHGLPESGFPDAAFLDHLNKQPPNKPH